MTGPHSADTLFHAEARRHLRRGHRHVSRPGADPAQDARLRPRRQRHARPAVRAHLARSRHRLRTSPAPARRGPTASSPPWSWPPSSAGAGPGARPRAPMSRDERGREPRRPAAAARGDARPRARRQEEPRPELHPRSQPDAAHRPRGRPARGRDGDRGRARPRRADARAVPGGRASVSSPSSATQRCLPALEAIAARYPGRLAVQHGDALEADWRALAAGAPKPVIVANLPYNVGTLLLIGWLESEPWPPWYRAHGADVPEGGGRAHRRASPAARPTGGSPCSRSGARSRGCCSR